MELRRTLITGAILVGFLGGGCATTRDLFGGGGNQGQSWTLDTSPKVPAASGKVTVSSAPAGNHTLHVTVQDLAQPSKVFDGASTYVVWVVPPDGQAQNMGVLAVDNDLKGSLQTKTTFRTFEVLVTAESSPTALQPTESNAVMKTQIHLAS
jgi:hypothetical protein